MPLRVRRDREKGKRQKSITPYRQYCLAGHTGCKAAADSSPLNSHWSSYSKQTQRTMEPLWLLLPRKARHSTHLPGTIWCSNRDRRLCQCFQAAGNSLMPVQSTMMMLLHWESGCSYVPSSAPSTCEEIHTGLIVETGWLKLPQEYFVGLIRPNNVSFKGKEWTRIEKSVYECIGNSRYKQRINVPSC